MSECGGGCQCPQPLLPPPLLAKTTEASETPVSHRSPRASSHPRYMRCGGGAAVGGADVHDAAEAVAGGPKRELLRCSMAHRSQNHRRQPQIMTTGVPSPLAFIFSVENAGCKDSYRRQCRRNRLLTSPRHCRLVRILTYSVLYREMNACGLGVTAFSTEK